MPTIYILLLSLILLITSCSDTATSPNTDSSEPLRSPIDVTIRRQLTSTIAPEADSVFVIVRQSKRNIHESRRLEIPEPGLQSTASFKLPSDTGYSVLVLAWSTENGNKFLHAGGEVKNITIFSDQQNQVSVPMSSWTAEVLAPEELLAGQTVTFQASITSGINLLENVIYHPALSPSEINYGFDQYVGWRSLNNGVATTEITPPLVQSDTALFVAVTFNVYGHYLVREENGMFYFRPTNIDFTKHPFRIPIKAPSNYGELVVLFNKMGAIY